MRGILILKKEAGMTSFSVVSRLRHILKIKKIGHTGTLDPEATGVLPVCIGSATKIVDFFRDHRKEYIAEIRFGIVTDTQDIFGTVLSEQPSRVTKEQFTDALTHFTGEISQLTPMYSARKVNGQKLCDLARAGKTVERKTVPVTIFENELLEFNMEEQKASFRILCSAGTYIRTLCNDLGELLGVGACMSALKRTKVGDFTLSDAFTLSEIESFAAKGTLASHLISIDAMFPNVPEAFATEDSYKYLVNGNPLNPDEYFLSDDTRRNEHSVYRLYYNRIFYGLYKLEQNLLVPYRMFLPEEGETPKDRAVMIGKFDGLHLGHQSLLNEMNRTHPELSHTLVTFDFHHSTPEFQKKSVLFTEEERKLIRDAFGITETIIYPFTETLRKMSPADFLNRLMAQELHVKALYAGENFRFGYERAGDTDYLREHGSEFGISCYILPEVEDDRGVISSTGLRDGLSENDLLTIRNRLGFPYFLSGTVSYGKQLGRTIGFRTANLLPSAEKLLPTCGVYASISMISGKLYYGMTNIGKNPTVSEDRIYRCETNLFGYSGNCYAERLTVFLCEFIRPEQKFSGVNELCAQLEKDRQTIAACSESGKYETEFSEIQTRFGL